MNLIIASNNTHKIDEIRAILAPYFDRILSQREAGLVLEVEETGETFLENALLKARGAARALGTAALADDSGLCVDCLDGAPGVYSARFAGPRHDDADNNRKLVGLLADVPAPRTARFVSAAALVYPDGREITALGTAEGEILLEPRGQDGFGYDPLFYYPPLDKTFAQMSFEDKNRISHRHNCLMALKKQLDGVL